MTLAGLRALFEGIELHVPVSMADLDELRSMVTAQTDRSVDVTLRGTPDRKHDGDHRVVIAVDAVAFELPVQS